MWFSLTPAWFVLELRMDETASVEGSCEYIEKSSRGQPTSSGPPAWDLGEGLTTQRKKISLLLNVTWDLGIRRIL
jgi:hypothetical protein